MIHDATDFYAWATQNEHGIRYDLITEDEYNKKKEELDVRYCEIKPLKGSMMLHAIVGGKGDGSLAKINTPCACSNCFDEKSFNVNS
ncbi:hypothetical protein DPMN_044549 [Dreissena polymorpha]|uniref:Uncharacterized protein n=1 Tax=Dreissena polymorpha TaxID=45954 RepID=A0A9D4I0L4_DREPO|nr:hypothetical protein DPMN_044549 [Dreissena polymorpha]